MCGTYREIGRVKMGVRNRVKTIVVSGAHSNIGKTSLAADMLGGLRDWSALKVTVKKESRCPRQSNCGVCSELKGDFDIVTERKVINKKGTDTARLKKAGAKKVIWLKSTLKGLKAGLNRAFLLLKDSKGVVIEGTSVLKYIKPDFTIYLDDKKAVLRNTARQARKKADIIIDVDTFGPNDTSGGLSINTEDI